MVASPLDLVRMQQPNLASAIPPSATRPANSDTEVLDTGPSVDAAFDYLDTTPGPGRIDNVTEPVHRPEIDHQPCESVLFAVLHGTRSPWP